MNKVIVVGSLNMDIITRVSNLPLPGETISGKSVEYLPGGKGLNQAVACAKMGAETFLAGCLGNDAFADDLEIFLKNHKINTQYLHRRTKESGTALITVADNGQNTIVVAAGSNAEVSPADIAAIEINQGDVVISQFEIPLPAVMSLFQKARQSGARAILNPSPIKDIPAELLALTDTLIVNETELGFLKGELLSDATPQSEIIAVAQKIRTDSEQTIIVTLGSKGALIIGPEAYVINGHSVAAIDTVGAGDCFAGVVASQLLLCKEMKECVLKANKAASICVTRKGAAPSMPNAEEVLQITNE